MADKIPTAKLLDEEARLAAERRALISHLALQIEKILIDNGLTMGELSEMMDLFNARAHNVFSKMKLQDIKNSYDNQ